MVTFRIATYNVHKCVGTDGRLDPGRVAEVINELEADIVALQEVDNRADGSSESAQMEFLAARAGCRVLAGPTMKHANGHYGNALLTRLQVVEEEEIDLSRPRREPRGAIDAVLSAQSLPVRVIATHLGLRVSERRHQIARLVEAVTRKDFPLMILMGDINEWFPAVRGLGPLNRVLGKSPATRSFPSRLPVLALDRIWVKPGNALGRIRAHKTPLSRRASDHLPVVAEIIYPPR